MKRKLTVPVEEAVKAAKRIKVYDNLTFIANYRVFACTRNQGKMRKGYPLAANPGNLKILLESLGKVGEF